MPCVKVNFRHGGVGIVTYADVHQVIAAGHLWRFEHHWFCGPTVVTKRGEPLKRQPGPRSPFWPAHQAWCLTRKESR